VGLAGIDRIIMAVYSFLQSLIPRPACLSSKNDSPHFHYDLARPNLLLEDCPAEIMQITSSFRLILAFGKMDE